MPGGKVYDSLEEYNKALELNVDISESAKKQLIKEAREEVGIEVKDISFFINQSNGATVVWDFFILL